VLVVRFIGLSGSFRAKSWNTMLLRNLVRWLPEGSEYLVFDRLDAVPYYAEELEAAIPEPAARLRAAVKGADGVFIASPEYNHSYTPVIKNAIDWCSRPVGQGVLLEKPVALLGAAPGLFGTVRAQSHLRQVLHATNSRVLARPEVFVNEAARRFDDAGQLVDPTSVALAQELVERLVDVAQRSRVSAVA
jgi:chromate reductase